MHTKEFLYPPINTTRILSRQDFVTSLLIICFEVKHKQFKHTYYTERRRLSLSKNPWLSLFKGEFREI